MYQERGKPTISRPRQLSSSSPRNIIEQEDFTSLQRSSSAATCHKSFVKPSSTKLTIPVPFPSSPKPLPPLTVGLPQRQVERRNSGLSLSEIPEEYRPAVNLKRPMTPVSMPCICSRPSSKEANAKFNSVYRSSKSGKQRISENRKDKRAVHWIDDMVLSKIESIAKSHETQIKALEGGRQSDVSEDKRTELEERLKACNSLLVQLRTVERILSQGAVNPLDADAIKDVLQLIKRAEGLIQHEPLRNEKKLLDSGISGILQRAKIRLTGTS